MIGGARFGIQQARVELDRPTTSLVHVFYQRMHRGLRQFDVAGIDVSNSATGTSAVGKVARL